MNLYDKPCDSYTDEELIRMIRSGDMAEHERALSCLHRKYFYMVSIAANKYGLDIQLVAETYNKAVMELSNTVRRDDFVLKKALKALLITIFKHRIIDLLRKKPPKLPTGAVTAVVPPLPDGTLEGCLRMAFFLAGVPENCWEMFLERMIDGKSPEELAGKYRYRDGHVFSSAFYEFKRRVKAGMLAVCQKYPACNLFCPKEKSNEP